MKHIIRTLLLACCCMQAQAQAPWKPDTELEKQLQQINPEKPDVPLNKNDAFQKVQKRRVQEKR